MHGHSAPPATSTTHQLVAQPRKARVSFRNDDPLTSKKAPYMFGVSPPLSSRGETAVSPAAPNTPRRNAMAPYHGRACFSTRRRPAPSALVQAAVGRESVRSARARGPAVNSGGETPFFRGPTKIVISSDEKRRSSQSLPGPFAAEQPTDASYSSRVVCCAPASDQAPRGSSWQSINRRTTRRPKFHDERPATLQA